VDNQLIKEQIEAGVVTTPCYIADLDILDKHVKRVLEIGDGHIDFCYAMKANPFLVERMDKYIGKIEVCSPGELSICIKNGIPGEDIVFSGVNKTYADIKTAIEYGVDLVTLESVKHFNIVRDYCSKNNVSVRVMPRLSSGAQFGMSEKELTDIIKNREEYPYLDIVGIHYFTGTQKKQIAKDIDEIELIDSLIKRLRDEYGFECKIFEYGLGLSVPYFEGENFDGLYDGLIELVDYIKNMNPKYRLVFELGRFFVFNSMSYLTAVDDIKSVGDGNICLVDGGIHHLNYYGQNMAMRVPKIDVIKTNKSDVGLASVINKNDENWKICGSLCTFADVLVRKAPLGNLELGDTLRFYNAGAYSVTEAPALFLSRRMPVIYSYSKENGLKEIRGKIEAFEFNSFTI